MTKAERKEHRRKTLEGCAAELATHPDNGSGWLYESDGQDVSTLSDEAIEYRISVLEKLVGRIRKEAAR